MDQINSDLKGKNVNTNYRPVRKHDHQTDTGEDGYPVPQGGGDVSVEAAGITAPTRRQYSRDVNEVLNYFGIVWVQPDPQTFLRMREAHKEINVKLSLLKS